MKAEELAVQILSALHGGGVNASHASVPLIEPLLRSYGLACAMKEREANVEVLQAAREAGWPVDLRELRDTIRSRPTGDALMKEIEG